MERSRALTIAVIVVTLLLAAVVGLQSILLIRMARGGGVAKEALGDVLQDYLDNQVDAGVGDDPATRDGLLLQQRRILISYDVNARTARQVVERLFYLDALDPKAPIDLYISTQGGWTDSAFSIVDAMRLISAPVNTWAIGGCYSAGAVLLSAGTGTRRAMSDAVIMVHVNLESSEDPYTFG
ncbi:MAG TPA: ATP-dependent Clp protease proteolytic subunit, partial [Candidatus Saccharimonadales bacterium]|nr:ATP-dependent Clp protease proteolytic subunit [Candidatus Saccharimonadales bacterium]